MIASKGLATTTLGAVLHRKGKTKSTTCHSSLVPWLWHLGPFRQQWERLSASAWGWYTHVLSKAAFILHTLEYKEVTFSSSCSIFVRSIWRSYLPGGAMLFIVGLVALGHYSATPVGSRRSDAAVNQWLTLTLRHNMAAWPVPVPLCHMRRLTWEAPSAKFNETTVSRANI